MTASGADDALKARLAGASLTIASDEQADTTPQDLIAAARADYRRLLAALYAHGYYGGTISIRIDGREAAAFSPFDAPRAIGTVAINVDTGPQFAFGSAQITPLAPDTKLPEGFAQGQTAEAGTIRQSVDTAVYAWRAAGHAKVQPASQRITARHSSHRIDTHVRLNPGPQLKFGALQITGNSAVRSDRLSRIAGLPEGAVYSPVEIEKAAQRLRRTNTFSSVSFSEADVPNADGTLPMTVEVTEAKPRRFGAGVELSTIDGLTVSSYWMHRNFLGGAERFRVDGEISGIGGETGGVDYTLGASLRRPAVWGADTDFVTAASLKRLDEPNYLLDQFEITSMLTRVLDETTTLEGGIGILAAREATDLTDREYMLLTFPLNTTRDRRDNVTNPKDGYFVSLDATPFVNLEGSENGARLFADARLYQSFGSDDRYTFAARTQIGSVFGATREEAPADFLFFSGGGGTVRGQPFQSLGIAQTIAGDTQTYGGRSFAGAQLETRIDITSSLGLVGFYDIGYVGEGANPFDASDWQAGTGFGLRYHTGIGPIRLDIATPTTGDNAGRSIEFYIGIGQSF
jgi:translocation and assembly module TamA